MSRWFFVFAAAAIACSGSESTTPTATIDDKRPIPPPPPKETKTAAEWNGWVAHVTKPTPAAGVTPLDEVPDSTWFTNRNAVRRLSPAAIRKGPALHPTPRDGSKWTVIGLKQTGVALGLRARDEAGDEYFLKFDPRGHDEVETGADVVVQRLVFAAGYNVPENDIVYVKRDGLSVAPPVRAQDVDDVLARVAREADGRYRVLASRIIPGEPIGGIQYAGTRTGDPNDRIPHEDRRDMRGFYSMAAWLNHTDIKPANTLEVWIPDRGDRSRGHVVHYLLDFGKALGAMTRIDRRLHVGFAHYEQPGDEVIEHVVTGTPLPWSGVGPFPDLRGLGWIESEHYDAATWKPLFPWLPFEKADRFDKFWGARLVASFTPAQIRAALDAARYSEPRTVDYLARVLGERQRKTVERLFREVAPLAQFALRDGALCFVDLWKRHVGGGATYIAELREHGYSERRARAKPDGTVCFEDLPHEAFVEIRVERPGQVVPSTRVHLGIESVTAIERR
jgi:hypothetical protein